MRSSKSSVSMVGAILVLAAAPLVLGACAGGATAQAPAAPAAQPPVVSEAIDGSALKRITLSPQAAQRLGLETMPVVEEQIGTETRPVVPYAAVVYDAQGETWAYEGVEDLTFVRHPIAVDHIDGDRAVLTEGPEAGSPVVTVGVAELWGVETGVGGGH